MAEPGNKSSFKEMVTSITIAFILAFVFRAFVIEAFVIPTGSMAPTLMGQHVRIHGPLSGYDFPVGPSDRPGSRPTGMQEGRVRDAMLGPSRMSEIQYRDKPLRAGDRILVLKYLLGVFDPERFDVVVFKSPVDPQTNFIKRLIGLPGEQVAMIDGDIFVRDSSLPDDLNASNLWAQPGWQIARKNERVQRTVWQDVFDSYYTPLETSIDGRRFFEPPWIGDAGWDTSTNTYRNDRAGASALRWDDQGWPIRDRYAYNESSPGAGQIDDKFYVSDIRVKAGIEFDDPSTCLVAAVITARGHEFKGEIVGGTATVSMRPEGGEWTMLASESVELHHGVNNVEFWHVDQSIELWLDGKLLAQGVYDWTPQQRILYATGRSLDDLLATGQGNILADPMLYTAPKVRWEFDGALAMHRVLLQRDLHYQSTVYNSDPNKPYRHARHRQPSAGSHPDQPIDLTARQYFCCGDNSPSSSDGRLWDTPDPWVQQIDETIGVVARELMIGRAFFVYFPSPLKGRFGLPIPDSGRLRLIW